MISWANHLDAFKNKIDTDTDTDDMKSPNIIFNHFFLIHNVDTDTDTEM